MFWSSLTLTEDWTVLGSGAELPVAGVYDFLPDRMRGKSLGMKMFRDDRINIRLEIRIGPQVLGSVGDREVLGDDVVGRHERQDQQHEQLTWPAGHESFDDSRGPTSVGRASDDVQVDWQRCQQRHDDDDQRRQRREGTCRLHRQRRQVCERAEVIQSDQTQHQPP